MNQQTDYDSYYTDEEFEAMMAEPLESDSDGDYIRYAVCGSLDVDDDGFCRSRDCVPCARAADRLEEAIDRLQARLVRQAERD